MNVWIFNHYAVAPNQSGGTRHYDLAHELSKKGHKVTIFASSFNHFVKKETINYEKGSYSTKRTINKVEYVWIKTKPYNRSIKRIINIIEFSLKLYKIANKEFKVNEPDIIIGSSVHPLAAYVGQLVSKKHKKIFYFEERDLWPQTFVDFKKLSSENLITKLMYKFEKHLYENARRIIVLFDRAPKYVISKGIPENKIIYLPNGVNLENYYKIKDQYGIHETLTSKKLKVVYTGSHGTANHLMPLIEAANILQNEMGNNDIEFFLVGDGLLKDELIQRANSFKLKNVIFLNSIPKEEIPYLLSQADLSFISMKNSPLYKWGFSMNKIYDYMAAGLPILMYANEKIVGDFKNIFGVTLSETPNDLVSAIILLIYDENYKEKASLSLRNHVENEYSWKKLSLKLEGKMIEDLLD